MLLIKAKLTTKEGLSRYVYYVLLNLTGKKFSLRYRCRQFYQSRDALDWTRRPCTAYTVVASSWRSRDGMQAPDKRPGHTCEVTRGFRL